MEASLYVLFPEDNAVIPLAVDKDKLVNIIAPLIAVKDFAREHSISLKVYYDSENVKRFVSDVGSIVDDGAYIEKPTNMLHAFISKSSVDVSNSAVIDTLCYYSRWDTLNCLSDPDIPVVIKSAFEAPDVPCILSLGEKLPTDYYQVSIIKDRKYTDGMPELKNIPLFFSAEECIAWIVSLSDCQFSLLRNINFEPTSYRWEKQRIYKHKNDGSYWYFDFFHRCNKIHYEVFNVRGQHIGEAGENGVLLPDTAKENRSISRILHGN